MDINRYGEVSVNVASPPEAVYAVVSDVTRTGEWSPECRRCGWIGDVARPAPGARFRGSNRSGLVRWSRLCEVVAAEPGREFAWRTLPSGLNRDSTIWRYELVPDAGGTRVTHSYRVDAPPRFPISVVMRLFLRHHADMRPQMRTSLERITAIVERESGSHTAA